MSCDNLPIYILDGEKFDDLGGFYDETAKLFAPGQKVGRGLDAFNDLLRGGFGAHDYGQPIVIRWLSFDKSKDDLGEAMIFRIIRVILDCDASGHDCKLELYN